MDNSARIQEIINRIEILEQELAKDRSLLKDTKKTLEENRKEQRQLKFIQEKLFALNKDMNRKNNKLIEHSNLKFVRVLADRSMSALNGKKYYQNHLYLEEMIDEITKSIRKCDNDCTYYEGRIEELFNSIESLRNELNYLEMEVI